MKILLHLYLISVCSIPLTFGEAHIPATEIKPQRKVEKNEIADVGGHFYAIAKALQNKNLSIEQKHEWCEKIIEFLDMVSKKENFWCFAEKLESVLKNSDPTVMANCSPKYNSEFVRKEYGKVQNRQGLYAFLIKWKGFKGSDSALRELAMTHFKEKQPRFAYRYFKELESQGNLSFSPQFYWVMLEMGKEQEAKEHLEKMKAPVRLSGRNYSKEEVVEEGKKHLALSKQDLETFSKNDVTEKKLVRQFGNFEKGWEETIQNRENHFYFFSDSCSYSGLTHETLNSIRKEQEKHEPKVTPAAGGYFQTCVVIGNDEMKCIGAAPREKKFDKKILSLSVGPLHSCVLLEGNELQCFDDQNPAKDPRLKKFDKKIVTVSTGQPYTCVLFEGNEIQCFMNDPLGATRQKLRDFELNQNVTSLHSGDNYFCTVLENKTIRCFGADTHGQAPAEKKFDKKILSVLPIARRTCVLLEGNEIQCLGENNEGQAPPQIKFDKKVLSLSAGVEHTCALLEGNEVECFGRIQPKKTTFKKNVISLISGYRFTCALLEGNEVQCLGDESSEGQPLKRNVFKPSFKPAERVAEHLNCDHYSAACK